MVRTRALAPPVSVDSLRHQAIQQRAGLTGQQAHPVAKRGLEIDFAAHRPGGDRRDPVVKTDEVGQRVERLLGDDGRVHVGDQQLFASTVHGLGVDVHRNLGQGVAHGVFGSLFRQPSEYQVHRVARREPVGTAVLGARGTQRGARGLGVVIG